MRGDTKSKLTTGVIFVLMVLIGWLVALCILICNEPKAEEIEILVNEYPVWVVDVFGDSTFQTVQIIKCWEIFPDGQRTTIGYKVAVDSSGCRIYEGEPVWFLIWAVHRALHLADSLTNEKPKK